VQLDFRPLGGPTVFKGEREGIPNAYSITSAFSVVGKDLDGFCEVAGSYQPDPDSPQRLLVAFTGAAWPCVGCTCMRAARRGSLHCLGAFLT
jgi:hypothetical protein